MSSSTHDIPDFSHHPDKTKIVAPKSRAADDSGQRIGAYKLLEKIGEGGMGSVYMAEQRAPVRRKVALKIIKPGMDSKQVEVRFEAERQALAMMEHDHIAKVFDAGTTEDGRPYFVMELVKGNPITDFCDENRLSTGERLGLFIPVCRALNHAHQKGVIHRDIKPSNVLVTLRDGVPVPKVIDFGIAKATAQPLTERTMFTQFGQIIGTLEYMSPEQAELNELDVDTRSDIYSMGVLLYELLTGSTPITEDQMRSIALEEILRTIREKDPPRPSVRLSESVETLPAISAQRRTEPRRLGSLMRAELDWIVMKALDKDRSRRYGTADAFARDIDRYLNDEPVEACPPSSVYELRKFVRRHRAATASAAGAVVMLVVIAVGSMWAANRFKQQERKQRVLTSEKALLADRNMTLAQSNDEARRKAEQQHRAAYRNAYLADMRVAEQDWKSGQLPRMYDILSRYVPKGEGLPDVRRWEWYFHVARLRRDRATLREHNQGVTDVAWHPSGKHMASADREGTLLLRDPHDWSIQRELRGADRLACCWSSAGDMLAIVGKDSAIQLWDGEGVAVRRTLGPYGSQPVALSWSPDGTRIACLLRSAEALVISTADGKALHRWTVSRAPSSLDWSHDGKFVAHGATLWDAESGKRARTLRLPRQPFCATFHPSRSWLATGHYRGEIVVLDYEANRELGRTNVAATVESIAWSHDGTRLATGSRRHRVTVWDAPALERVDAFQGHVGWIDSIAWGPDDTLIVSGGEDGLVKVWDAPGRDIERDTFEDIERFGEDAGNPVPTRLEGMDLDSIKAYRVSPDGERVAAASNWLGIWDTRDGRLLHLLSGSTQPRFLVAPEWSPDGRWLATGGWGHALSVWDTETGLERHRLTGHTSWVLNFRFSPDGDRLATRSGDGSAKLWDVETGRELLTLEDVGPGGVVWSRDGRILINRKNPTDSWDASPGYELANSPELSDDFARRKRVLGSSAVASESARGYARLAFAWSPYANLESGDHAESLRLAEKSIETQASNRWALEAKGLALCGLGRNDEARATFERCIADDHSSAEPPLSLAGMALACFRLGRAEDGNTWLEKARQAYDSQGTRDLMALHVLYDARIAAAEMAGDSIASPELLVWQGRARAARGDWPGADAAFRRASEIAPPGSPHPIQTGWWRTGPFDQPGGALLPPGIALDPFTVGETNRTSRAEWSWRPTWPTTNFEIRKGDLGFHYALKYVWSPDDREVALVLGDDDQIWLFVNEMLVFKSERNGVGYTMPEHFVPAMLHSGWNILLIKVWNTKADGGLTCQIQDDPHAVERAKRAFEGSTP